MRLRETQRKKTPEEMKITKEQKRIQTKQAQPLINVRRDSTKRGKLRGQESALGNENILRMTVKIKYSVKLKIKLRKFPGKQKMKIQ